MTTTTKLSTPCREYRGRLNNAGYGWPVFPTGKRGGYRPLLEVLEVRRRYAAGGVSQNQLGREFGVSGTWIGKIVHRSKWRHL